MKEILVLLVLLNARTTKVCAQPYQADGNCRNPTTEYLSEDFNLCCKRCPPGQRLKEECTKTTETVCEQCPTGQYMENNNFSPNCLSCNKCKATKGLQYAQNCSSTTRSRCACQPGMFCLMEFDYPYCTACRKYMLCKAGYGVSVPGKANSDVKCERCPDGTFSDRVSYTDRCQPHTNCPGIAVRKGNATSDTVCKPEAYVSNLQPQTSTKEPHTEIVLTTASTMKSTVSATTDSKAPHGLTDSTLSIRPSVSVTVFHSAKSLSLSTAKLAALIAIVTGLIALFITIILLCLCKRIWKKDAATFHPKVDANGNCESGDKISQGYLSKTQQTSFTVISPEQQCLLEKGQACSDQSQGSSNTETLTTTDDCSSHESIGPLQSIALYNPLSALSQPMTLLSNTEPVTPQPSVPTQSSTQSSSQPTTPQINSPVTTSPHVNVNITFHIGNGSGGTPSVMPTDLIQVDSKLPFGEEEESFSIPQQEDGKQSLMSVQESASYSV